MYNKTLTKIAKYKIILIIFFFIITSNIRVFALDSLIIDSIGLKSVIHEYDTIKKLRSGLMYDILSDKVGADSNVVIFGHRYSDKYGQKLNTLSNINMIALGDKIRVVKDSKEEVVFKVYENYIVGPDDDWVTYDHHVDTGTQILTLYSCSPMWDNSFRYIIKAVRVTERQEVTDSYLKTLRNNINQASNKKAIFNQITGVEPATLHVKVGEFFDAISATRKVYQSKIYKFDKQGTFTVFGKNNKQLNVIVE
jgi:LPXTG-site transpeptidase (sortase) family protein